MNLKQVFIGRDDELAVLSDLHRKPRPNLVIIKGRRRIGKSRLVAEFALRNPQTTCWSFAGLAPQQGITAQSQREHFARQLAMQAQLPPLAFTDWSDAFSHLALQLKPHDIVLFDEISWLAAGDASFVPKLKAWWDQQSLPVLFVICGSVSTWIEDNILNSTAFFGRVNFTISLAPLLIPQSYQLLTAMGFQGSSFEAYKLLSILGGVPWYLEQANRGISADELIQRLCFTQDGLLVMEFDRIFHDLFNGKGSVYKKIITVLKDGMRSLAEIRQAINFTHSGTLSQYMDNLIVAGFVTKQRLWSFKTKKPQRQSLYRISDPYLRFYLKLIEPQRHKIDNGGLNTIRMTELSSFEAHMGLQLEYLLLQNRPMLLKSLGVLANEVVCDGPYRQTQTASRRGCQIDYLLQTTSNTLFICEFKFSRRELHRDIIDSLQAKINALTIPRGFAAVPVLFHIGGVSASVATSEYFYRIVDISTWLELETQHKSP